MLPYHKQIHTLYVQTANKPIRM